MCVFNSLFVASILIFDVAVVSIVCAGLVKAIGPMPWRRPIGAWSRLGEATRLLWRVGSRSRVSTASCVLLGGSRAAAGATVRLFGASPVAVWSRSRSGAPGWRIAWRGSLLLQCLGWFFAWRRGRATAWSWVTSWCWSPRSLVVWLDCYVACLALKRQKMFHEYFVCCINSYTNNPKG